MFGFQFPGKDKFSKVTINKSYTIYSTGINSAYHILHKLETITLKSRYLDKYLCSFTTGRMAWHMKLKELIKFIGDDVAVYIDGKKYYAELPDDMSELEFKSIDVKTDRSKDNLESLGYSFEVGV